MALVTSTTTPSDTDRDGAAPLLLGVPDARRVLGIGSTCMNELLRDGTVRSVMIGRRRLIPVSALQDYVGQLLAEQS